MVFWFSQGDNCAESDTKAKFGVIRRNLSTETAQSKQILGGVKRNPAQFSARRCPCGICFNRNIAAYDA